MMIGKDYESKVRPFLFTEDRNFLRWLRMNYTVERISLNENRVNLGLRGLELNVAFLNTDKAVLRFFEMIGDENFILDIIRGIGYSYNLEGSWDFLMNPPLTDELIERLAQRVP